MKRFLTYALCVILVLGMIPASIISAFAQGKGVAKDETQNQSIDNAPNQYIPETITVDGNIDDLGWKEWITVDSVSGVWNNATVSDDQKGFSYTYSIRRDHEYLYVAVNFSEELQDFNIYYSSNDGANVTTVSFSVLSKQATVAGIAVDECVAAEDAVEFKYRLVNAGEYVAANTDYKYFIGVNYDGATLFYPAIYPDFSSDYKELNKDATAWDNALQITYSDMLDGAEFISEYVNIDGRFTESYWTHLTNFHMGLDDKLNTNDYKNGDYDLINFDEIQFSDKHYLNGSSSGTPSQHLKLKADVRMDQYSIYGAAFVQHGDSTKDFDFRLYIKSKDGTIYKIIATYKVAERKSEAKIYKGGDELTEFNTYTGAAIIAQNIGNIYAVEFRFDLRDLGDLAGAEFQASVLAECKSCDAGGKHYIASTDGGTGTTTGVSFTHSSYAWNFKYEEKKNDDLSNDIAIDGIIESATFKSLLTHDRFLYGYRRPANYDGANTQPDCRQFAYAVHSDYEYLYCAALVELKDADKGTPLEWLPNQHSFNLYVNKNAHSSNVTGFTKGIKLYLDNDKETVKIKLIADNDATETATDYTGNDIQAVIVPVKSLHTKNASDTRYAVEFKVPLSLLEISSVNDFTVTTAGEGSQTTAFIHSASVDDDLNAKSGLAGPVPSFNDIENGFKPATAAYWWTSHSYAAMAPAVMADGTHIEKIWTDAKDGSLIDWTEVNYTNATINPKSNDALNALRNASFRYKIVPGRENLYCAAQIDPIDFNDIQFALWIKVGDKPIRFALRNTGEDALGATLNAYWYDGGKSYGIERGYDDTLHKPYVKYSRNKVDGKYYVELIINYKYFGKYNGTTWADIAKDDNFKFEYFVALEEYNSAGAQNEMLYPALASAFKGNVNAYTSVTSQWVSDLTAKAATIEPLQHIAPETIKIDGNLNDPGWSEDQWVYVSALSNAVTQSRETIYVTNNNSTDFSFKYQLRHDDEYLYVGAVMYLPKEYDISGSPDKTTKGGTQPEFRIWITPKDIIEEAGEGLLSFKYLYDVHAKKGSQTLVLPQIEGIEGLPNQVDLPKVEEASGNINIPESITKEGNVTLKAGVTANAKITYNDMILRAAENWAHWYPNGGNSHVVTKEQLVYDMVYGDTVFYGYTDIVQENENHGTTGEDWYADVKNESYTIGNQHAIICSGEGKNCGSEILNNETAVVEFKIKKSEFDPNNSGFEYCFTATVSGWYDPDVNATNDNAFTMVNGVRSKLKSMDYALHYPARYYEPGSTYAYNGLHFPYWNWVNALDFADIEEEAKLRNNTTPVVSLGAKICENYIAPDNGEETGAIRFGARYEEKYIRYLAGMDDADYWDVKDMGIVILPTYMLENLDDLTIETPNAAYYPADNIVNWQHNASDGWSNFADYENFVFYVTLWGIDANDENYANMDFAFRGYMTFYEGVYDDGNIGGYVDKDFYGDVLVRNYNEVKAVTELSEKGETDESKPVLPDGDYGESQPPVEVPPSKEN